MIVRAGSAVEGLINDVRVQRGDRVAQGDVLAALVSDTQRATLRMAEARAGSDAAVALREERHAQAERHRGRQERLASSSVVASVTVEDAQTDAQIAGAELAIERLQREIDAIDVDRARAELELRTIRSPIAGIVTEVTMSPGEYRDGQDHVVIIAQMHPLHVEVFAPVTTYGRVGIGNVLLVDLLEPVGSRHAATVLTVDTLFDAASGTYGIRLGLPNADYALPAGVRCTVLLSPEPTN